MEQRVKDFLAEQATPSIFMIDDKKGDVLLIKQMLLDIVESRAFNTSIEFHHSGSLASGISKIKNSSVSLIFLNLDLPDGKGINVIGKIRDSGLTQPIIALSARENENSAIEAVRHGAQDYLVKDEISEKLLFRSMFYAIERHKLRSELRQALDKIHRLHGLLPICAKCKQVKDDDGYWQQIERYISDHSDVKFTHGYCPKCFAECLAEVDEETERIQEI